MNNKFIFLAPLRRFCTATVFSGAALLTTTAWSADRQVVKGHVPEAVAKGLAPTGRLPKARQLDLAIGLPLRNQDALAKLLPQLYDPASPMFHKFLDPQQFTASFGPSEQDYQAVRRFAESNGLTIIGTHPNRMVLDLRGTVANVEKTFHVNIGIYPHPKEPRTFYAPDVEPALDLTVPVLTISGLSDYSLPHPSSLHARPMPVPSDASPNAGSHSGEYIGLDFRAAYVPGVTLTGAGQSVALVEFDTYYAGDITKYLALNAGGLTNSTVNVIPIGVDESTNTIPGGGNTEVSLDIDMAICMAPGLSNVYVYEAPNNGNSASDDIFNRIATDNNSRQISSSWSGFSDSTMHQILQEFATQGQSFFIASGDSGAYINPQSPPSPPCDDTYVTSVGGTTLSTDSPQGAWSSETTWNWFSTSEGTNASSGGVSPTFAIPSWQQGVSMTTNQGSATFRNIPDVAMAGDQIYVFADNGTGYDISGTSAASPLWAGFMALVNQQNALVGNPPAGFFNPALYAIAEGTNYSACFHDITTGNNTNRVSSALYYAVPGYDLCTGWGTPVGNNLINLLAAPADVLEITPLTGFSTDGIAGGPFKQVSQNFLLTNAGTTPLNWTLTNSAVWLSNSVSAGALPVGGFTNVIVSLNVSFAETLPLGVYTTNVTFKNTSDGVTQNRLFTLTLVGPELVQNGGFETGAFSSWTFSGDSGQDNFAGSSTSLTTTVRRHTTFVGSDYIHTGSYAAFMGEPSVLSHLTQTLPALSGQAYLLSFWLDNPGIFRNPPTPNEFMVSWNGNTLFDSNNMAVFNFTNMQFVVSTTNTSAILDFGFRNDNDYFGFDDVSVSPIPAPVFQSVAATNGAVTLMWSATPRVTYQLQYATTLSPPNWTNLGDPATAISSTLILSDVQPADPQRFYRLVIVTQ